MVWAPHGGGYRRSSDRGEWDMTFFGGSEVWGPPQVAPIFFTQPLVGAKGQSLFFVVFGTQESNHVHAAYGLRMVLVRGLDMGHGAIGYCVRAHFSFLSPLAHPRMHPPGMGSSCLVRSGRWKALKY